MILWQLLRELLTVLELLHAKGLRSLLRECGRITVLRDRIYSQGRLYGGSLELGKFPMFAEVLLLND